MQTKHPKSNSGSNFYLVIFAAAFASYMARLDSHVVNISLPAIAQHFGIGTDKASLVVLANLLTTTSTLILAGKLGDRFGLVRTFKWGYLLAILSALACSLAPNFVFLVAARTLQGLSSAILMSMAFAIIAAHVPNQKTGKAFGLI
ncbi:MAG TPA: MFS transporter, partial [Elusimicrobiales bacterium]|nr:MFS transporter [Elusimicrobiales bacterium]